MIVLYNVCNNSKYTKRYILNLQYTQGIHLVTFSRSSRTNTWVALKICVSVRKFSWRYEAPIPQLSMAMLDHTIHVPDISVHVLRVPHCVRNIWENTFATLGPPTGFRLLFPSAFHVHSTVPQMPTTVLTCSVYAHGLMSPCFTDFTNCSERWAELLSPVNPWSWNHDLFILCTDETLREKNRSLSVSVLLYRYSWPKASWLLP